MTVWSKLLTILVLLASATLVACQDKPDTIEDTGKQPPLDLLPIERLRLMPMLFALS